jgi:hypothetical protein
MGMPTVYRVPVRKGTTVRTDLTAAEWRKVERAAKRLRISRSQFVGRAVRLALEIEGGPAAPPVISGGAS